LREAKEKQKKLRQVPSSATRTHIPPSKTMQIPPSTPAPNATWISLPAPEVVPLVCPVAAACSDEAVCVEFHRTVSFTTGMYDFLMSDGEEEGWKEELVMDGVGLSDDSGWSIEEEAGDRVGLMEEDGESETGTKEWPAWEQAEASSVSGMGRGVRCDPY
jgi:hypothetical protein